jgi:DNA-binding GntR family transcriptional regulator
MRWLQTGSHDTFPLKSASRGDAAHSKTDPSVTMKAKEKTRGLADEIVTALRERILIWRYPPLYRLTEELLCSEFSVSRSPAREALRILETDGLLSRLSNRGFVVKQLDQREVEELYEIRFALELYAIQTVAEKKLGAPTITALRNHGRL